MLAHVIHTNIHQFAGIKSASPQMWCGCRMGGLPCESKVNPCVGKGMPVLDSIEGGRVPGYGGAHIIKQAVARHVGFRGTTFLSGAAIVADTRLDPGFRKPVLDGSRGQQRCRAKQIMPAPMAVTTFGNRFMFGNARLLAQAGKGIKFTENGDYGAFISGFANHCCRHATDILRDPEAFGLKRGDMFLYRPKFFIERFWRIKHSVCQLNEGFLLGVDQVPDGFLVLNAHDAP